MQLEKFNINFNKKVSLSFYLNFYKFLFYWAYFVIKIYSFFSIFSSFFLPKLLPIISKNFSNFSNSGTLEKKIKAAVRFKKRNLVITDVNKIQVKAAFSFIKRRVKKKLMKINATSFLWNRNSVSLIKSSRSKKVKSRKSYFFKKRFFMAKKSYFLSLKALFFKGKLRKKKILKNLGMFRKKSYRSISLIINLNSIKVLNKIFPFFDRFFILKLVKLGFFYVNFTRLQPTQNSLKVGDFVSLVSIKKFNLFYYNWLRKQRFYIKLLYKNLFQYFRSKFSKPKPKNYLKNTTVYNNFYKSLPKWVEVNYLSLSFFIIKTPDRVSFRSYNFNPFLFKLLLF